MSRLFVFLALLGACHVGLAVSTAAPQTDADIWNEGVEYYRAGDVTNALRVLRPLMLTKDHGARAAEIVAALELQRDNREEAARAAQIALRTNPTDARVNRNYTRAVDGLPAARLAKHIDDVLKAAQGRDPGEQMLSATRDARHLLAEAATYTTNAAERTLALSSAYSTTARKLADAWIPLRQTITQSVTNEEQAATILAHVERAQARTLQAAEEFEDLNPEAYASMGSVENDLNNFLKLTILPPGAVDEDLVAQSNAWSDAELINGRPWQQEALDYTRSFRAKFPAWARAYEQQAQADTNKSPFTAEDQAKISALATELEKIQLECNEKSLPPQQEQAMDLIRQIRELLPKDNNNGQRGQQGQQNQPPQSQNQPPQSQNQPPDKQPQDQPPSDETQQDDPEENQQQNEEEQQAEEKEASEGEESEDSKDEELEGLLKKAQERNDEHEAEKKARMRKMPLPPIERDW